MCYQRGMHTSGPDTPEADRKPSWRVRWLVLSRPTAWPWWLHRSFSVLSLIALALGGAWLALMIAGTTQAFVGPLAVDLSLHPTFSGQTVIHVDPVGAIVLDTHKAPVTLNVAVRQIDLDGIRGFVADPNTLTDLDDRIVADLADVLVDAIIRAAAVAVTGAILATALVLRSVRRTLLAAGVAVTSVAATYGLAAVTYSPASVREPVYTGPLAAAPQLIGNAEDIATNFDAYAEQLAGFVTNVGAVYNTTLSLDPFQLADDTVRVLHVSDLHLNPAAWEVIDTVAEQYDVDVIVDTGDIVDQGTPLESAYVRPIASLERPYVFVKGNHDSIATVAAVATNPNAIVLDDQPVEVAGLRFIGAPDPRFTPDKSIRGTNEEDILIGTEDLAEVAADLDPPADVLVFHDPTHAELFDTVAPLVLSGHAHKRDTYVLDGGTRIMVQGSTGGAGLRGLQNEDPTPVALSVLYLDPETKQLIAWDDLTLGGLGRTSARIDRHQADSGADAAPAPGQPSPAPSLAN